MSSNSQTSDLEKSFLLCFKLEMATAYAALLSVMHIIDQLQIHPRPPMYLDQQQLQSLTQTISFLQQFMEAGYTNQFAYSSEADPLEMRIADAAHAVEDVIESYIVDRILADDREEKDAFESEEEDIENMSGDDCEINFINLYEDLQAVIDELKYVEKEAMDVKEKMSSHEYQLPGESSSTSSSLDGPQQDTTMVGFDDILEEVLAKLTGQASSRQIISITGMGGIGKATLAKNVYQNQLVVEHFDLRAWVKIYQQYCIRNIFLKVIGESEDDLSQVDENELGTILHKKLTGRRYLVIMDDIWDIEIWDRLTRFLPDNKNGSRIMITTRLSNLARQIDESHNMAMDALDEDNSWNLFCKHVFGKGECPLELQEIGWKIVEGCEGHPLSISVVGGLLARSKRTKQYWEGIFENLNSIVNLENEKHCLQILYTSYNNLPVHLKPCFLFMGLSTYVDEKFLSISSIVWMLALDGLVKPISGKSIEEAATEYIVELVERNLIILDEPYVWEDWLVRSYGVHDLLKDLCFRECEKQKFCYVVGHHNFPNNIHSIRRICVDHDRLGADFVRFLESAPLLRSLYKNTPDIMDSSLSCSRLWRYSPRKADVQKVNLRMIVMEDVNLSAIHSSISRFWNLQMVLVYDTIPLDIWMMPSLRIIIARNDLPLPDPPSGEIIVLKNLHFLVQVKNVKRSEEVVKRIPHIKFLQLRYEEVDVVDYCLYNLGLLQQLKYLRLKVERMQNQNLSITFPRSLISLALKGTRLHWDDMNTKIASLPLLQYLSLGKDSCVGPKWETIECQFCSLKLLNIQKCDLENWMTESTHFPRLEGLFLESLPKLEEIPSDVGDIPMLRLIKLTNCSDSVKSSAQRIKEEQEYLGNEDLKVEIVEVDE